MHEQLTFKPGSERGFCNGNRQIWRRSDNPSANLRLAHWQHPRGLLRSDVRLQGCGRRFPSAAVQECWHFGRPPAWFGAGISHPHPARLPQLHPLALGFACSLLRRRVRPVPARLSRDLGPAWALPASRTKSRTRSHLVATQPLPRRPAA